MVDFAVLAAMYIAIFSVIDYVLIKLVKPNREVMKNALIAGIIMSLTIFSIEAYTNIAGIWGYKGTFLILGIPVTVPIYFVVVGFGFPIFFDKADSWLKKKIESRYTYPLVMLLSIPIVSAISLLGDFVVAQPEWAWAVEGWIWQYTYFVWVLAWTVNVVAYYFIRRIRGSG
jgi:hypothetical protein